MDRKFRLWDKKHKEYVRPLFLDQVYLRQDGKIMWYSAEKRFEDETDKFDIEFCTGLKDKNGVDEKDVYAGDKIIVTDGDGEAIGTVTMNDKTGQWVWLATEIEPLALTVFVGREIPLWEVLDKQYRWNGCLIGDIHTNPELLKA